MPKKFKGENSKAAEARARKEAKKEEAAAKKQREVEDELWRDDDKHVVKKQQRKEEREKKRNEQLARKKEAQKMLEEEESTLPVKPQLQPSAKVTRAEIEAHRAAQAAAAAAAANEKNQVLSHDEVPLEENLNRELGVEGEARTVEEALSVLSTKEEEVDKHPERRAKAAYAAFEAANLPALKAENPNMRLSQLKHMLRKDWMKSPQNPLNQRLSQMGKN